MPIKLPRQSSGMEGEGRASVRYVPGKARGREAGPPERYKRCEREYQVVYAGHFSRFPYFTQYLVCLI